VELKNTIEECCEEENIATIDKLYETFGYPSDVVNSYYFNTNIQEVVKQIRLTKYARRGVTIFGIILLIGIIAFSINVYHTYRIFEEQQIFLGKTIISDPDPDMLE